MLRIAIAAALLVAAPQEKPPFDGAKAGKDLHDRVEAKIQAAKSIRYSFKVTIDGRGLGRRDAEEIYAAELLLRNPGELRMSLKTPQGGLTIRSDGKIVVVDGEPEGLASLPDQPKELADLARRMVSRGFVTLPTRESEGLVASDPTHYLFGGREKVGEVETQVISYDLETSVEELGRITVRAWIDPVKLAVVKREYDIRSFCRIVESVSVIAYDEALPADEFALQSARAVRDAVEGQIARSVELYAQFMGRLPESLDDLDAPRKDAGAFWPEGGFWIGGKRPADVKYAVAGGVATIGARTVAPPPGGRIAPPTERLKLFYASRLRMHLVAAGVAAWHKAYFRMPSKIEDLAVKPEGIDFWPEGGFIASDRLKDAWGDALVLKADRRNATVMCARRNERMIRVKNLTAEESKGLVENAWPPATPEAKRALDATLDRLTGGDIEERETAAKEILALGPPALAAIEARLADVGVGAGSAELKKVRERLQATPLSWKVELGSLVASIRPHESAGGSPDANERRASTSLKTITTAQADFRSNDRDGNRVSDFWVKDVSGLYGIVGATGRSVECRPGGEEDKGVIIKLIEPSVAAADATEGRWEYPVIGIAEPEPYHGYFISALKKCVLGGETKVYLEGSNREDMFGYIAYPAEYGVTGRLSFIVNEDNTIWCKDLKGETVDTFPAAPGTEGWKKID